MHWGRYSMWLHTHTQSVIPHAPRFLGRVPLPGCVYRACKGRVLLKSISGTLVPQLLCIEPLLLRGYVAFCLPDLAAQTFCFSRRGWQIYRLISQTGHSRRVGSYAGVFGSVVSARDWRMRSSCSLSATAKLLLDTFIAAPSSMGN